MFSLGKTGTCTNSCAGPPRPPTRSPTLERLACVFFAVTEDRAHTFGLWFVPSFCRCASAHHPSVAISCSRLEARGHAVGFRSLGIRHIISRCRSFCRCAAAPLLHIMLLLHVHVRGSVSSSQMLLRAWNHRTISRGKCCDRSVAASTLLQLHVRSRSSSRILDSETTSAKASAVTLHDKFMMDSRIGKADKTAASDHTQSQAGI